MVPHKDPEVRNQYGRNRKMYLYDNEPWRAKCWSAREKAKKLGLDYNIDPEYVKNIWPKDNKCPALGIDLRKGKNGGSNHSPSLDRIIPKLGYIKGNVQVVCNLANKIMNNATPNEVIKVGEYFKKIMEDGDAIYRSR
jgi:hypothetical protein